MLIQLFYVNGNHPIIKPSRKSFISIILRAAYNISGLCRESLIIALLITFLRLITVFPIQLAELRSKNAGIPRFYPAPEKPKSQSTFMALQLKLTDDLEPKFRIHWSSLRSLEAIVVNTVLAAASLT